MIRARRFVLAGLAALSLLSSVTASFALGKNTFTGDQHIGPGTPWVDVTAFGCVADSATDNSTCVANAVAALIANHGYGKVYFPPGNGSYYCVFSGISITTPEIALVGDGWGSRIATCGHDVALVTMNATWDRVQWLYLCGKGARCDPSDTTFGASHPTLYLQSACGGCIVTQVTGYGGVNNINVAGQSAMVNGFYGGDAYQSLCAVTSSVFWNLGSCDQSWPATPLPGASITGIATWAPSKAYATSTVVQLGSHYIQATFGGTSGGSSPTLKNFGQNITDGSVTWQLLSGVTNSYAMFVNGASEAYFEQLDMTGPMTVGMVTAAGTGVMKCTQCIASQTLGAAAAINGGTVYFDDLTTGIPASKGSAGVLVNSQTIITGGQINGDYGVRINGGTGSSISGANVSGTNQASFAIASGVGGIAITGNTSISDPSCFVNSSASTHITFVGNVCNGGSISAGRAYAPAGANP